MNAKLIILGSGEELIYHTIGDEQGLRELLDVFAEAAAGSGNAQADITDPVRKRKIRWKVTRIDPQQ